VTSPVGSSVPGNTPISDEAVSAFLVASSDGSAHLPREVIEAGLRSALPLLVSAEAERLGAELRAEQRQTRNWMNEAERAFAELAALRAAGGQEGETYGNSLWWRAMPHAAAPVGGQAEPSDAQNWAEYGLREDRLHAYFAPNDPEQEPYVGPAVAYRRGWHDALTAAAAVSGEQAQPPSDEQILAALPYSTIPEQTDVDAIRALFVKTRP
jgi:hypothetical protein